MKPLTLAAASITPGYALQIGEERKLATYAEVCLSEGIDFIALVMESEIIPENPEDRSPSGSNNTLPSLL